MLPFLPLLLKVKWIKWVWDHKDIIGIIILALALIAGTLYIRHVVVENGKLEKQVEDLTEELKTERENHKKIVDALEGKARDAEERQNFKEKSQKEIERDRKNGDAPMAPVLRNTLDRLRTRQAEFQGTP